MNNLDNVNEYEYTRLSRVTVEGLEDFIGILHSKEEIEYLINEFVTTNVDGKGEIERELVKILMQCDSITNYTNKYSDTICDSKDRMDNKKVLKAAEQYRQFIKYFPDRETLRTKFLDEKFSEQLLKILNSCKTSVDYITRLVKNRINDLSPEIVCEGDSTRLLIFKQFLKAAAFPKTTCMPRSLKN